LEIILKGTDEPIFGLHLSSMFSKWGERRRVREIRALLKSIERHQHGFHTLVVETQVRVPYRERVALLFRVQGAVTIGVVSISHAFDSFALNITATQPNQPAYPGRHT